MSSATKGTAFEDRVHAAIEKELAEERLGLNPNSSVLHKKKGYYSRDRDSDIIVDVSIELWLPSASNWSLLWVCECKGYSGAIPVDDVEEFKAKLDQISGANRKGIIATTGALQQGALRYAKSNGIGLVRLLPDNQVAHVLYQLAIGGSYPNEFTEHSVEQALLVPNFVGQNNSFYGTSGDRIHRGWKSLLADILQLSP